ncbi:uncharacterized protein LOC119963183 [Scyliorhinus canicula]|uniref:uncharacterized protein LOC119963183 n=1 Tax=Scyliorhinus canicula TaxID=7830 RepID=UPI0018F75AC3|nr:uncharacterized protein LOC119963183 [Scyliorhinus canicula]
MAYLTFFAKLLLATGILEVLSHGETTVANQTSGIDSLSSAATPDPEPTFNSTSFNGAASDTVVTMGYEIASSANASDNNTIVTTEIYSTPIINQSLNPGVKDSISDFPDNSSSARTVGLPIPTELQDVSTRQRSDTQASSAATTTAVSYSVRVSSTQELFTTLQASGAGQGPQTNLGLVLTTWVLVFILILILTIVLACYLRRRRRRYSFDLFHKTAEDADIPLSSSVFPGTLDAIPDKEDNNYVKMNEDKIDNDKTPELNAKQNNCETESNHSPANPVQDSTDNLDDWKSPGPTFTDIDLMDCVSVQ